MKKPELFEAISFELTGPITEVENSGERLMQITGIMHRANIAKEGNIKR